MLTFDVCIFTCPCILNAVTSDPKEGKASVRRQCHLVSSPYVLVTALYEAFEK